MGGEDVDVRFGERAIAHFVAARSFDDEVVGIQTLDRGGDFAGPRKRAIQFVPGLPPEDRLVIFEPHAGVGVHPVDHEGDRLLEVADQQRVGPEFFRSFPPEGGVFLRTAPPPPVVNKRNDDTYPDFVGDLQHFVVGLECLLVEHAGAVHVADDACIVAFFPHGGNIDPRDLSSQLPDRCQCIADLVLIGNTPWISGGEFVVVFHIMDVGDIEGDEAKLLIPVHELVPLCGDKVCELCSARRGRENCQDRESDEDVRTREWSHNAPSPVSGDACVIGTPLVCGKPSALL